MIFSFVVMLLLLSYSLQAQFEGINLNTYKLTDYRYNTLGTRLNASNDGSFYDIKRNYGDYSSKSSSNHSFIQGGGNLDFSSTIYSRKYSGYQSVDFGFNTDYNDSSNDYSYSNSWSNYESSASSKSSSSNSVLQLNVLSRNRFYLDSDFFWGVTLRANQSYTYSYSKTEYDSDERRLLANLFESENSVSLQVGKGRIENVTDARLAVYILDDLLKQGRLSHTPSEEEVFAFADFITKTLNKRVIDSRIKSIKEYVAIDSFLVSNGLTNKTDGLYFGLINDNWNYARSQSWRTGSELYVEVSPFINYSNKFNKQTDEYVVKTRNELSEYGVSFGAGFRSSWISGLKWQKGYNVNASFNIFKYDTVGSYYSGYEKYNSLAGAASYYVSFIPNTRTKFNGTVYVNVTKYLGDNYNDRLVLYPGVSGSCYYYFSETLRLSVGANAYYSLNKGYDPTSTSKGIGYGLRATLYYYIF